MLPSSSSQLAKCGQINHYKKFWIMQTQLEKQDQSPAACSAASTTLCLAGTAGNMSTMKESKLSSSPSLLFNGDTCSRPETAASAPTSNSKAIVFPFCSPPISMISDDPSTASIMNYNNNSLGLYPIINTINSAQALSLAVNFSSNSLNHGHSSPADLMIQRWDSPAIHSNLSELVSPFPCQPSECSTVEESGCDVSTSNSSTHQQINNSFNPIINIPNEGLFSPSGRSFAVRSCTLCGTTKTPLWRTGPEGPKSLCNACGIRVKKSRRLQASIEGGSSSHGAPLGQSLKRKLISSDGDDEEVRLNKVAWKGSRWPAPLKLVKVQDGDLPNRFSKPMKHFPRKIKQITDASAKVARLLNNRGRLTKAFAKDEEEAAVLLMALSCGLVLA